MVISLKLQEWPASPKMSQIQWSNMYWHANISSTTNVWHTVILKMNSFRISYLSQVNWFILKPFVHSYNVDAFTLWNLGGLHRTAFLLPWNTMINGKMHNYPRKFSISGATVGWPQPAWMLGHLAWTFGQMAESIFDCQWFCTIRILTLCFRKTRYKLHLFVFAGGFIPLSL